MLKFNVGQIYATRSICNHDCIYRWQIVKRTEVSVWIQDVSSRGELRGKVERKKIQNIYSEYESIYPTGQHSMAPILRADDLPMLDSPEQIALETEFSQVQDTLREYHDLVIDIQYSFTGDDQRVRLESLAAEYGIEILKRRKEKLLKKMAA